MDITFLGQGYEPTSVNSVGNHLLNFLLRTGFNSFTGISAFASEAGVYGLSEHIQSAKQNFKNLTLIVGIDQEGTSKEALEAILSLRIDSYIFYQSESPIFHPKIYLFEGDNEVKLIVGSSNLTRTGLFTNVESSLLIEFNTTDKDGVSLLANLKNYYQSLFDFSDPNLFKIDTTVIHDFVTKGIVPNENTRRAIYSKKNPIGTTAGPLIPAIIEVPRRAIAKVPTAFLSKPRAAALGSSVTQITTIPSSTSPQPLVANPAVSQATTQIKVLIWESGPLTQRDLTIPKGKNTNQTGSMLLKKGKTTGIDQKTYFRNQVFPNLAWAMDSAPRTSHIERATGFFRIIIMGIDRGIFPLSLSHNTKTNTKSFLQNNSMTSLSWGKARQLIASSSLIGKSASLYSDAVQSNQYILEIN